NKDSKGTKEGKYGKLPETVPIDKLHKFTNCTPPSLFLSLALVFSGLHPLTFPLSHSRTWIVLFAARPPPLALKTPSFPLTPPPPPSPVSQEQIYDLLERFRRLAIDRSLTKP